MKRFFWIGLSVVLLASMGYSIVGLVTKDSPTVPRPPDRKLAERLIVAPAGSREDADDFRDPLVTTGASSARSLAEKVGGNGVVEPNREEIAVSGDVPGRIAAVLVVEGARVDAGAPLIALEDSIERASLQVAEAELEAARTRRDKVLEGSRAEEIREVIAQAREAQARATLSRNVYARTQRLADGKATTDDELDRAKRQAEADTYAAASAEARRAAVVNGSRAADIAAAEAEVRISEARVAEAQARLALRTVRAPESGEVLQVKVRVGEYLQPGGEAPIVLGDTAHLTVRVDVDERDFARVAIGAPVEVTAKAFGDKVFAGKVRELAHRMGRKNLRTDDPTERNDTKILEVVVALDRFEGLIVGQRVTAMISVPASR